MNKEREVKAGLMTDLGTTSTSGRLLWKEETSDKA